MSRIVVVNKEALERVARELGLGADVVEKTAYRAVNAVAAKNLTRSRREIHSRVYLTTAYIRERMSLRKANTSRPVAVIAARRRPTRLATYGAKQLTRKDQGKKRPPGHYGGKRWGVHAGSGDSLRNISTGSVPAGISVAIKRGSGRKKLPGAFFMPLKSGKSDSGNGMGVFMNVGSLRNMLAIDAVGKIEEGKGTRRGIDRESGNIRQLFGPSVDDLFYDVIDLIAPDVEAELEAALLRQARYEFAKALGKT